MKKLVIILYLVAFIRLNLFVKIDLQVWLDKPFKTNENPPPNVI